MRPAEGTAAESGARGPTAQDLAAIEEKVLSGVRLTAEDALALFQCRDLFFLGRLASEVTRRRHGDRAFFIRNQHINPTNVCVHRCTFCSYRKGKFDAEAYTLSLEEVEAKARAFAHEIQELHIVGGLHPDLPFSYYEDLLRRLRAALPHVHLKAFTAVEIDFFSKIARLPVRDVLLRLKAAGLDSLPGGGAEIFAPAVRERICGEKIDGQRWLEIMEIAHGLGIRSNATMLYGHLESLEDRVDHLLRIRELQDRTGGFMAFIPLAFHPEGNRLPVHHFTTALDDLRTIAVSRLVLDNVEHIKAYWVMLGERLAQVALHFGADDIDGTVVEERIYHAAGSPSEPQLEVRALVRMIRAAGKVPVERDTFYRAVRVWN